MSITRAETSLNYLNTTNYLESNSNIVKHLKEIFGEDINLGIENIIIKTKNKGLIKLNNIFGGSFLNSCFHPDEYGIGSYRASSLINTAEIAELIEIDNERIYIDYLDTINNAGIKGFPNIKMSGSNLITKINEIPNNNSRGLKESLRKSEEVFLEFLKISSFDKTPNNKVIEYIDEILSELNINDSINEFIGDKENDKFDKIEKEGGKVKNRQKSIEKTKNRFTNFLLGTKIKDRLLEIKKEFQNNLLHSKYKNGFNKSNIYGELQNSIFTILINESFGDYKELLENKSILKNGNFNLVNSYDNEDFTSKATYTIKEILNNDSLGEDLLTIYFNKIIDKSGGRPVEILSFGDNGRDKSLLVYKEKNGDITYHIKSGKNHEEISNEDAMSLLKGKNTNKYNLSGNMTLFILNLSGAFHIGSERGYRELISETLLDFFKKNNTSNKETQDYIDKVVLGLGIFDTFEEEKDNSGKSLAGSVGSIPSDMIKLLFIGGVFANDQIDKFVKDNSKVHEIDNEKLFDSLSSMAYKIYEKIIYLEDGERKKDYLEKFEEYEKGYKQNKDINTFLEFLYFCYNLNLN